MCRIRWQFRYPESTVRLFMRHAFQAISILALLDVAWHLCKRVCPSVCQSVRPLAIQENSWKRWFQPGKSLWSIISPSRTHLITRLGLFRQRQCNKHDKRKHEMPLWSQIGEQNEIYGGPSLGAKRWLRSPCESSLALALAGTAKNGNNQ